MKLESADQVCTPWKSMGAHKGQATTPYFFDLDALSVGAHDQTDYVQH